ncbi:MAG: tRNA 2-thiouridine(34) synthase MnmA [Clostridia bacterium]|nr:tRNA 2-thiouridine(34) synthase MnmA [Clostridia bacterium]
MPESVLVGMSGGVDSSVAAAVLLEKGFMPTGCTLRLFDKGDDPLKEARDAADVCERLGIAHIVPDLRELFCNTVIQNFLDEYLSGRTPNPCIVCNKTVKFGRMLDIARENGIDKVATGHYATVMQQNGRYLLIRPKDRSKDQTYVLYHLTQDQLAHTLFPLNDLTKDEAREMAERYGFVTAHKKDSQDICFVPDGDYAAFIEKTTGISAESGNFIDTDGRILGTHKGVIRYTVGQRKGLGIALGKPAFVLSKDADKNTVTLDTDEQKLFYRRVLVEKTNFIPFDKLTGDLKAEVKLRYRHTEQPAVIHPLDNNTVLVEFNTPQRAPSPGQAAVFYDGDTVLGGGTIVKGEE